ncbi:MAG: class I SAM-dependent methyltransferase [Brachymonas sp.]|nr:class I SAM-dependent methyltransferase [Brachymonas sp.]
MESGPVHASAQSGFSRGAATYAKGRPDYPGAVQALLTQTLGLTGGRHIADVGAGTGKFTRLLLQTGAHVTAVEPVANMRQVLEQTLAAEPQWAQRLNVLEGTAQALPLPSVSMDAVCCAQAFHWFASRETLNEFARVLKPDGWLVLVWNERDHTVDWVNALTRMMAPYEGTAPRFHTGAWRAPFPHHAFGALHEQVFAYQHVGTPEQVLVNRTLSISFIAALPQAEQDQLRQQMAALIDTSPALRGRSEIAYPYTTRVFYAQRLAVG